VTLDSPTVLTHAAFTTDDRVIAVGPRAVVAVAPSGKKQWEFRVPADDPPPDLSAFTFVGSRLVMRLGVRCLIALDTESGKPAWVRDVFGRTRYDGEGIASAPRFGPVLGTVGSTVIAQREDRWWQVSAATGEVERAEPTAPNDWGSPPTAFRTGRLLVPDEGGAVAAWVGKDRAWRFDPTRPASWTGTPPAFRTFGDDLLVAVSRNYGCEVQRVAEDRKSGMWSAPRLIPTGSLDLSAADADPDRFYLPTTGSLFALNRRTGREEWRADLPPLPEGSGWRVLAGRRAVIATPRTAVPADDLGAAAERSLRRMTEFPSPLRLLGGAVALFDACVTHTLPVLLFDPDSGRLDQRIDLPATGPTAVVCLHAETATVATTGRLVWLKGK